MSPLLNNNNTEQKKLLRKYCIVSGVLAGIVMMIFYFFHSNSLLFGDATVLRMDLYHQYGPLYAELFDRLVHSRSLIYSWTSGLGNSFIGNLFNYCSSPFALIILLFGHKNMPEAIAVMILLKAALSAVSFTYYVNKSNKCVKISSIGFALLYTFSGYFVAYSWNIMWLDAMAVFPFVILGIERIINEKKPTLYIVSLIYTMIANYYMAYMVCILSVLYFLFYYISNYPLKSRFEKTAVKQDQTFAQGLVVKEDKAENSVTAQAFAAADPVSAAVIPQAQDAEQFTEKLAAEEQKEQQPVSDEKTLPKGCNRLLTAGFIFACSSFLCFLVAAFALIPVYFCLKSSSATGSTFPKTLVSYFNVFDFIANHLPSVNTTIRSSGDNVLPNVYCGMAAILLMPVFFLSEKIASRKKLAAMLLLAVFYFSFSLNYLNYIWHGFHYPNDLPYRFSFGYVFLLLILSYQALLHITDFSRKYYVGTGIAALLFVIFVQKLGSKNVTNTTLLLSAVFIIVYVVLAGIISSKYFTKKNVETLLIFAIVLELLCCDTDNFIMSQSKKNYTSDYNAYREVVSLTEKDETELFYRTELSKLRARMDPSWYGYNGVSVFSSMAYENTSAMMKKLGMFGNNINSYTYYPQTPVFNAYFSLRYIYDNADLLSEGYGYTKLGSVDPFDAYKNEYYLPLAFSVKDSVLSWDPTVSSDPFEIQNELVRLSAGVGGIFEHVDATDYDGTNINSLSLFAINAGTSFYITKSDASQNATAKVIIDVEEDGRYYVYAGSTRISGIKFKAEDDLYYNYLSSSIQPFIIDMGERKAGDRISVEYTMDSSNSAGTMTFCAVKLNKQKFERAYNTLCENGTIQLTDFRETEFTGTINVTNEDGFLFTSIPYDKSWNIYVDGEKLNYADEDHKLSNNGDIVAVGNGLIGFALSPGKHTVRFKYIPRGLTLGVTASVFGIMICIVILLIKVFYIDKNKNPTNSVPVQNDAGPVNV